MEKNPDHPYDDPRVTVHVNDGRAFLERTDTKYDLILFALPDSLTLVTGASQIRLESFLFTEQALEAARDHLKPDGAFAMYNYYREDWLVDRLAGTAAGGLRPRPVRRPARARCAAVIVSGLDAADQTCGTGEGAVARLQRAARRRRHRQPAVPLPEGRGDPVDLPVDARADPADLAWPRCASSAGPFRRMRPYADLFFMGAAFLLLETKIVTGFALLFGTTWVVNAIVFAGRAAGRARRSRDRPAASARPAAGRVRAARGGARRWPG